MIVTRLDYQIRIILFVAGLLSGGAIAIGSATGVQDAQEGQTLEASARSNIASILLYRRGAMVTHPQQDVVWLNPPAGDLGPEESMSTQTFLALAAPPGTRDRDLYRIDAKISPQGRLFDDSWIVNLTRTIGADDNQLTCSGTQVATVVSYAQKVTAIEIRDFAGEKAPEMGIENWSRLARLGNQITNLEETGQGNGIGYLRFDLTSEAPAAVSLQFSETTLEVWTHDYSKILAKIDLATDSARGEMTFSSIPSEEKMRMSFLNWLADRGRGFADQGLGPQWAGDGIELLKEVYFKAGEVKAGIEEVSSTEVTEPEAPETVAKAEALVRLAIEKASLPWPPAPIDPLLDSRAKGEGIWVAVNSDEVQHPPQAPPPFYRTWIRPDPEHPSKKVYVVVWDPASVQLNVRAGTREPEPQTGYRGDGRIPRRPEVLEKVVAGFNGGFQTSHIWYGMMVDRKVLLRPRVNGATVGTWSDGRTAFGTWKYRQPIPKDLVGFRQNLSPLIEDGVFNPYGRKKWGWHRMVAGAVEGRTARSSICYTKDQYALYAYAEFADENGLARALKQLNCQYAIHLDMNKGHTGFEFYRLAGDNEFSEDGAIRQVENLRFKGTRLHPTIDHMKAPTRYLGVDYRDFFYLSLRPIIPGTPLEKNGRHVTWKMDDLPGNNVSPAGLAYTKLELNQGTATVIQMDLRGVTVTAIPPEAAKSPYLSVPMGQAPTTGSERLSLGGYIVTGHSLDTAPVGEIENAVIIIKEDPNFAHMVHIENAIIGEVMSWFEKRSFKESLWRPAKQSADHYIYQGIVDETASSDSPANAEQPADSTRLLEVLLGRGHGVVVMEPKKDVDRLVIYAKERPSRIVRLFPRMNAKRKRTRNRSSRN